MWKYEPRFVESVVGNMLQALDVGTIDAMVHAVNCQGALGGFLGSAVKHKWPEVDHENRRYCGSTDFKSSLLGSCLNIQVGEHSYVINAYTQLYYGAKSAGVCYTRTADVREAVRNAYLLAQDSGIKKLAFPKGMCCNTGGAEWNAIARIIDEEAGNNINIHSFFYSLR